MITGTTPDDPPLSFISSDDSNNRFFPKSNSMETLCDFTDSTNKDLTGDPVLKKVLLDVSEARKDRRERKQIEQCMCDLFDAIHPDFVEHCCPEEPNVSAVHGSVCDGSVCDDSVYDDSVYGGNAYDTVTEDRQSWPPHTARGLSAGPQSLNTNRSFSLPAESSLPTLDVGGLDPFALDDYHMTRRRSDETYAARRRLSDEYLSGGPVGMGGGSTSFTPRDSILGDFQRWDSETRFGHTPQLATLATQGSEPIEIPSGTRTRGQQRTRMRDVMEDYPAHQEEVYRSKPPSGKGHNTRGERVCCNRLCGL
jgi:hypothetical protein